MNIHEYVWIKLSLQLVPKRSLLHHYETMWFSNVSFRMKMKGKADICFPF